MSLYYIFQPIFLNMENDKMEILVSKYVIFGAWIDPWIRNSWVCLAIGHLETYSISSCVYVMCMPTAFYLQAVRETGDWGFILRDSYHAQLLLGFVSSKCVTTKNTKTEHQRNHRIDFFTEEFNTGARYLDYELFLQCGFHLQFFCGKFNKCSG